MLKDYPSILLLRYDFILLPTVITQSPALVTYFQIKFVVFFKCLIVLSNDIHITSLELLRKLLIATLENSLSFFISKSKVEIA